MNFQIEKDSLAALHMSTCCVYTSEEIKKHNIPNENTTDKCEKK